MGNHNHKEISLEYVVEKIQKGELKENEVYAAKTLIDNEIMQCEDVIKDQETELYSRREFQSKLSFYRKLRNRL